FTRRSRRVPANSMSDRLDAHSYPAAIQDYLGSCPLPLQPLGELCSAVFNGQTQPDVQGSGQVRQATVANLSATFLVGPFRTVLPPRSSDRYLMEHDLRLCNAAHSKSYIGKHVTYHQGGELILPSTEVMVLRSDRSAVPASYVRTYLK